MKLTIERPHFAVFDDVLKDSAFREVNAFFQHDAQLEYINRVEHLGVWSLDDGHPLASQVVATEVDARGLPKSTFRVGDGPFHAYPTESPLDHVLDVILAKLETFTPWIGAAGRAWKTMTGRAFVYPVGTSLDWHDDGGEYSGAFSFYTHATWHPRSGGELLVATPFRGKRETASGEFVVALPNRLVLVKGGTAHKIGRVTTHAGANHRMSVSGFFSKRDVESFSDGTLSATVL
jgi:2OG-Fe(II) oxygenase superfamily